MKDLSTYIIEELDDNLFWLIDKWFELNNEYVQLFIELIAKYNNIKFNKKELESELNSYEANSIKLHLKEFVNFIDNDIDPVQDKDYIQKLLDIIKQVANNKSNKNKYINKGRV
jgi:hypothetical protein